MNQAVKEEFSINELASDCRVQTLFEVWNGLILSMTLSNRERERASIRSDQKLDGPLRCDFTAASCWTIANSRLSNDRKTIAFKGVANVEKVCELESRTIRFEFPRRAHSATQFWLSTQKKVSEEQQGRPRSPSIWQKIITSHHKPPLADTVAIRVFSLAHSHHRLVWTHSRAQVWHNYVGTASGAKQFAEQYADD